MFFLVNSVSRNIYYYREMPFQIISCFIFSVIIYIMSGQPLDIIRFLMFFAISLYIVLVAQSVGLMIGAAFNVVVSIKL